MDKLVAYVTEEPKEEAEERKDRPLFPLLDMDVKTIPDRENRYKYANVSCEMLVSDCPQLTEALASEERYRNKLYSFLQSDAPFNPLLASFLSKTMGILIARRSSMVSSVHILQLVFYYYFEINLKFFHSDD